MRISLNAVSTGEMRSLGLSGSETPAFAAAASRSTLWLVPREVRATKHDVGAGLISHFVECEDAMRGTPLGYGLQAPATH
jgi:hypothetical protein